jgi:cytochrome c peroxidase
MRTMYTRFIAATFAALLSAAAGATDLSSDFTTELNALKQVREGRDAFRYATFGDEVFWGDTIGLHEAIAGVANGGVGPGLSPAKALEVGLKVDVDALPRSLRDALARGQVDLKNPKTTLALLKLNAVVGVTGFFDDKGAITSMGIQCAFCHSTVDNSFTKGIGHRRDGWANRDLNVGAIVALAPRLQPVADVLGTDVATVRKVLRSWGPGKFDAVLFVDGKAFRPDGKSAAVLIPPAFGLAGVNLHTWTGWGGISHWNAFVANLEMHGQGTFFDPRLDDPVKFPIAARNGFGHVQAEEDRITALLPALQIYQLTLAVPRAPKGSYNAAAAERGERLFNGKAKCSGCHVPPLYTEPGWNMHTAEEIGIDDFQAKRSPDERYRTAPLRGLWTHTKGGFYHDGRFPTLNAVVLHYNDHMSLGLTSGERWALMEYLKSL